MNKARIKLLFLRFFRENWKKDLLFFSIFFAISILGGARNSSEFVFTMFTFCFIYFAGISFSVLKNRFSGEHYLMIPANGLEKVSVNIILVNLYYGVILWVLANIGVLLGVFIRQFLTPDFIFSPVTMADLQNIFHIDAEWVLFYLLCSAIFTFGSVYFKRRAIIKTIGVIFAFFSLIFLIDGLLIHFFIKDIYHFKCNFYIDKESLFSTRWAVMVIEIIIILFFWGLTYLRLKETEI